MTMKTLMSMLTLPETIAQSLYCCLGTVLSDRGFFYYDGRYIARYFEDFSIVSFYHCMCVCTVLDECDASFVRSTTHVPYFRIVAGVKQSWRKK